MEPEQVDYAADSCVFMTEGVTYDQLCAAYEVTLEINGDTAILNTCLWASSKLNEITNR